MMDSFDYDFPLFTGAVRQKLTAEHKLNLALLIRKKKAVLLGTRSSKTTKKRVWDEILKHLLEQDAPITDLHHLRKSIWGNMKRKTKAKALSGDPDCITRLDRIVLDIIGPSIDIKLDFPKPTQDDLIEPDSMSSFMFGSDPDIVDSNDLSYYADQKPTVFTLDHRLYFALFVQANQEVLLNPTAPNAAKTRKWDEIYIDLTSRGAQIRSPQHLRRKIWDNMKRRTMDKQVTNGKLTDLDCLILDIIQSSSTLKKQFQPTALDRQANSSSDSGIELPTRPKVYLKTDKGEKSLFQCVKCFKSFTRKFSLFRHYQQNHNEDGIEDFSVGFGAPENSFADVGMQDGAEGDEDVETNNIFDLCNQLENKLSNFPAMLTSEKSSPYTKKIKTEPLENTSTETDAEFENNSSYISDHVDEDGCPILTKQELPDPDVDSSFELNDAEQKDADSFSQSEVMSNKPLLPRTNETVPGVTPSGIEAFLQIELEENPETALSATKIKIEPGTASKAPRIKYKTKQMPPHKILNGRFYCLSGQCKTDEKSFQWSKGLREHFQRQHMLQEEKVYYCSICAKGFAREAVKKRHEKIHQQVKANEELKNNVDEVAKPKLIKYTKPVPAAPKTFVCEVCGDTTQDRKLHNKHIQIHEELQVTCSYCDLKFPTKNHYEHHVKRQHTMILKCNVCDKIFGSKKPFERHMMIHSGIRPYVCETCGASYITKGALKTHNQTAHLKCFKERPRSFLCEPCGKGFISKSVLYTHIDSVHMGARNYKCAICNQSYKTKSQLNEHERRHAKDSIPCPMCSLVFNCKANLKKHMRRKKMSCPSYVPTKKPRAETV